MPGRDQRCRCRGIHRNFAGASHCRIGRNRCSYRYRTSRRRERHTSTLIAVGGYARGGFDSDALLPANRYGAAFALRAVRLNHAGDDRLTGVRLNGYRAARRSVRGGAAARRERNVLRRLEYNLAVLAPHRGVGVDHASLPYQAAVNADLAALRDDLTEINHLIVGRRNRDPHIGRVRIDEFHALAGSKNDFSAFAANNPRIGNIRRDKIDRAAGGCRDLALVFDAAGAGHFGKTVAPAEKIRIRQTQRGRDETARVNLRTCAEHYPARIDQEYATTGCSIRQLRLQFTEYFRGISGRYSIEHSAGCRLLKEAGDCVGADRKRLPVDDRARAIGYLKQVAVVVEENLAVDHLRPERERSRRWVGGVDLRGKTGSHRQGDEIALPGFASNATRFFHGPHSKPATHLAAG